MNKSGVDYVVREARPNEFVTLGQLMIAVYSRLDGFPTMDEQPSYYEMLAKVGDFTRNPQTKLLVAVASEEKMLGGVVYFSDMKFYGSGGTAPQVTNASGIRLLAVDPDARGLGIGKALTEACIDRAKKLNQFQVVLHTTKAMQIAWGMYQKMGFKRSMDLDFLQGELPVFGFRLNLDSRQE